MGFLTPLYIAGLAALALPLLFHLIRRIPRGEVPFSSLMFLTPTPPRITRRSRLDQLVLLALRALALALVALAFSRPFFRDAATLETNATHGRRVAILVDVSASMRRDGLWEEAIDRAATLISGLRPTDQFALFVFDRDVTTLVDFDEQRSVDHRQRAELAKRRLANVSPTWASSDLGGALATIADRLDSLHSSESDHDDVSQIALISDLQQGASVRALHTYEWPVHVDLELYMVTPRDPTNASIHWITEELGHAPDGSANNPGENRGRQLTQPVRVVNAANSQAEQFELVWMDMSGQVLGKPLPVYVPPGQGRIFRVSRPPASGDLRLVLTGDSHNFDNTLYVIPQTPENVTVAYLGEDATDDPQGCRYYIERALAYRQSYMLTVKALAAHEPLQAPGELAPRLVVVAAPLSEQRLAELLRYLEQGGRALYTILSADDTTAATLLGSPALNLAETRPSDYALLGAVEFSHPLLAPFADPRYSDFTQIHFWRYRRFVDVDQTPTLEGGDVRILAKFDNGAPALLERTVGDGRCYILMTSWRPVDSQLARSSKFVPLLWGMLGVESTSDSRRLLVGEPLKPPANRNEQLAIILPNGTQTTLSTGEGEFRDTNEPGVYVVGKHRFVAQLDPAESETAPMAVENLEALGVRLKGDRERQVEEQRRRHLRDIELEGRQAIWRWLLALALGVLIFETWLAGYKSRPRSFEAQT